jgi:hypothetical protein
VYSMQLLSTFSFVKVIPTSTLNSKACNGTNTRMQELFNARNSCQYSKYVRSKPQSSIPKLRDQSEIYRKFGTESFGRFYNHIMFLYFPERFCGDFCVKVKLIDQVNACFQDKPKSSMNQICC